MWRPAWCDRPGLHCIESTCTSVVNGRVCDINEAEFVLKTIYWIECLIFCLMQSLGVKESPVLKV